MSRRTFQWHSLCLSSLRALSVGIALSLPLSAAAESDAAENAPANAADPSEQPGADETNRPDTGSAKRLGIELNKLEQADGSCRVYLVFENALGTKLEALQFELILFDTDGFIKDHVTLDAAPIDSDKTSVKRFDLAETQCERVGRILVNDVLAMAGPEGALPDPISRLDLSSKLDVDVFK
ncbi:MAG: hypothetical protein ACLFQ1_00195 [Halochromatium sp.]|uniref:hypothetical protein n=1 Tax=Halochromatium sp. TaxID=2049430 RepID=UPI00397C532F